MSNPVEFSRKQIEKWSAEMVRAAEMGDYEAWQHAERELNNYKEMEKKWEAS